MKSKNRLGMFVAILTVMTAGCDEGEKARLESLVRSVIGDRSENGSWSVSLVRIGNKLSTHLEGPGASLRGVSFIVDEEQLQALKVSTLVYWTDKNPGISPAYGEYLAGILPGAKFFNQLDCAHWPQWEKPEEHDQIIIDFIKGG